MKLTRDLSKRDFDVIARDLAKYRSLMETADSAFKKDYGPPPPDTDAVYASAYRQAFKLHMEEAKKRALHEVEYQIQLLHAAAQALEHVPQKDILSRYLIAKRSRLDMVCITVSTEVWATPHTKTNCDHFLRVSLATTAKMIKTRDRGRAEFVIPIERLEAQVKVPDPAPTHSSPPPPPSAPHPPPSFKPGKDAVE
jgi:hypothetical protein